MKTRTYEQLFKAEIVLTRAVKHIAQVWGIGQLNGNGEGWTLLPVRSPEHQAARLLCDLRDECRAELWIKKAKRRAA